MDSFYDDGDDGAAGADDLYWEGDGEEGDEDYGYWAESGAWVNYTQAELDEYWEQDSSAVGGGGDFYGADEELFDADVAAADEQYLAQSGDLPSIAAPEDYVAEDDGESEAFFLS